MKYMNANERSTEFIEKKMNICNNKDRKTLKKYMIIYE